MNASKDKLIVAIHFDIEATDIDAITDIIDKLRKHFDRINRVDILNGEDYHADISSDKLGG